MATPRPESCGGPECAPEGAAKLATCHHSSDQGIAPPLPPPLTNCSLGLLRMLPGHLRHHAPVHHDAACVHIVANSTGGHVFLRNLPAKTSCMMQGELMLYGMLHGESCVARRVVCLADPGQHGSRARLSAALVTRCDGCARPLAVSAASRAVDRIVPLWHDAIALRRTPATCCHALL